MHNVYIDLSPESAMRLANEIISRSRRVNDAQTIRKMTEAYDYMTIGKTRDGELVVKIRIGKDPEEGNNNAAIR